MLEWAQSGGRCGRGRTVQHPGKRGQDWKPNLVETARGMDEAESPITMEAEWEGMATALVPASPWAALDTSPAEAPSSEGLRGGREASEAEARVDTR
ncbi:unnamed protein product [Calypogeia fissa]